MLLLNIFKNIWLPIGTLGRRCYSVGMKTLDGKQAIQFGWETTKANFWFFLGIMAMLFVTSKLLPSFFDAVLPDTTHRPWVLYMSAMIICGLASAFVRLGFTKISLQAVDKKSLLYQDFFALQKTYWPYIGASILFAIAVTIGTVLFIVPGVMIGLAGMFYVYIILDKHSRPVEALKESARITKGYKWQLLGFMVWIVLINMAGALLLGLGLLWTLPLTSVAVAHMYRQLV